MSISQTAEVHININAKDALREIKRLEDRTAELHKEFSEAFKRGDSTAVQRINRELQRTESQLQNVRRRADNIRAGMQRLNEASPRDLQKTIRAINAELNSGRVRRGSKEWDAYVAKLKAVKAELAKLQAEQRHTVGLFGRLKNVVNNWGASIAAATAAFAGLVMSGKSAVQAYADMEQEEANVRKFTGMTAEEVSALNEEFKRINTRTSREELNKLAQEAGRLGKTSQEDVLGFVRAADQINVALDDLGDGATLTLSKLTGIFGDEKIYGTEKSLLKVGSVINELSQNCSASAPYLAEFASRMGGVASQAGMTIQQVMAFGAVLDTNNQKVEASATALSQVLVRLYQDPAKYAKVAGLDVAKFTELMKKDANQALIIFLSTLNKAGGMDKLSPMFKDMGETGSRAIAALSSLASNIDQVKWQQEEANKAFREGISVTKEFDVQNNTVQAGLDKARKGFNEKAILLGQELLTVMRYCISSTSMMMRAMLATIKFAKEHKAMLLTLTMAIVGYTVAVKAAVIAEKARSIAMAASTAASKSLNAVTLLLTATTALFTGQTRKARLIMMAFNATIKANPIGLLVGAIATAITAIGAFISKTREEIRAREEAARQRRQEAEEYRAGLTSISAQAQKYASEEIARLKKLYSAATNQHKATSKRISAARELIATYPEYFKNMSQEDIMLGKAIEQYERLKKAIIESARAKAAQEKIQANESEKLNLEMQFEDSQDMATDKEAVLSHLEEKLSIAQSAARGGNKKAIENVRNLKAAIKTLNDEIDALYFGANDAAHKMAEIDATNERLAKKWGEAAKDSETVSVSPDLNIEAPRDLTDKENKALEKKAKAEAAARKKALKEALKGAKGDRDNDLAVNTAGYAAGLKDYTAYLAERQRIEMKYLDDQLRIYEEAGMQEESEYAALLNKKEELAEKHVSQLRDLTLNDLESQHDAVVDRLTRQYYDANSAMYRNDKAYRQALLIADIDYLEKKKALYTAGSQEWEQISKEIAERVKQDQLDKLAELADAYEDYKSKYAGETSDQDKKALELASLKSLLDSKLITWQEYNAAVNKLDEEYRDKAIQRASDVGNEYSDMTLSVWNSFKTLFEDISDGGEFCLDNLAKAAQSAFAVMSAIAGAYSSYVDAERDAELAKVEARYDREIDAAGKNSKKKEKLEAKKEEETAKLKKKYNDRAMKIELAQAVAQTAQAAIAAYASAAAIPVSGWIMAPIAAALATAAGMVQIATIKKQHQAEAAGYYSGGFTRRDPDNRREVGVVHANEFVANHQAVGNPALSPVLRLLDHAQRNNTVGSLTARDVSNALGQGSGVSARGAVAAPVLQQTPGVGSGGGYGSELLDGTRQAIDRLNHNIESGIEAVVTIDGERGFERQYSRYKKLKSNTSR